MSAKNRQLSRRWFEEVWNDRRTETIAELMSPDGIGHMETGDLKGAETFQKVRDQFLSAFPDLKFEVEDTIADGDDVVVRWRVTGTHTGDGIGIPPCHRKVTARGMTWHRYKDGVMVEGWDSWNQGAFFQHLQEDVPTPGGSAEATPTNPQLSERLVKIREELFGESGGPEMARRLGLPARTWYNYETSVTVPAGVILAVIERFRVEPHWLYTGEGPHFRGGGEGSGG